MKGLAISFRPDHSHAGRSSHLTGQNDAPIPLEQAIVEGVANDFEREIELLCGLMQIAGTLPKHFLQRFKVGISHVVPPYELTTMVRKS